MKVTGIIVEYNPFHNGHIYHLKQARLQTKCDILIAVMSSSFNQRGEPCIIDKWTRAKLALEYGVDLIIELPFNYASQSADYFAYGALKILNALHIDTLFYGSENNDNQNLIEIAKCIYNNEEKYNTYVKEFLNQGNRYPNSCNQALSKLMNKEVKLPNDLLALSYIKEIIKNDYPITPNSLQRTNSFHSLDTDATILSASSIRHALKKHQDVSHALPGYQELKENAVFIDDYFDLLQHTILTNPHLEKIHLVEEGFEQLLKKHIFTCSSMDELINQLTSKRYTRARIQRTLLSILINNTHGLYPIDYIRVLGMNEKGQHYLHDIKKTCSLPIITNFSSIKSPLLDFEFQATKLYSLLLPINKRQTFIEKEYKSKPLLYKLPLEKK